MLFKKIDVIHMQNSTLFDFEPENIEKENALKSEDEKVMNLLGRFSAKMLKDALRKTGHPLPEWGDGETWRFYYLDECRRRGRRLLEQLDWPTDENSLYVNIYTGCVEKLIDVADSHGYFSDRNTIDNQVWSVIEHWEPYDPRKPNKFKIKYLENEIRSLKCRIENKPNGPTCLKKNDKKYLKNFEEQIQAEQSKIKVI